MVLTIDPWRKVQRRGFKKVFHGGDKMDAAKIAALVFIVAGVLGLMNGSFSYTKKTHKAALGPLDLSAKDTQLV